MPPLKSDIRIIIEIGEKRFSLNCKRLIGSQYAVKRGRAWSEKRPTATLTEIFNEVRKWAVRNT